MGILGSKKRKNFIPSITPEFDNRYSWGDPNSIPLPRSPELFEKRLKIALKYVKTSKIVMIGTWNDFLKVPLLNHQENMDLFILS